MKCICKLKLWALLGEMASVYEFIVRSFSLEHKLYLKIFYFYYYTFTIVNLTVSLH